MNTLCDEFVSLRYGSFKNICKILSIDYDQTQECDVNNISYICFHIIKRRTNEIVCISPQSSMFNISRFHPSQIANMKVHYKSFDTEFNFNPISNNMITSEYIDKLRAVIKNVILEIIHNLNPSNCGKKHIYEDKMPSVAHFKKNDDDSYEDYFVNNVVYYIKEINALPKKIQKVKNANNLLNFINYNLDYLTENNNFVITTMKKIIEFKESVNDMIHNIISADNIIYNDITICINILDSMTKLSYNLTRKFGNINIDVS